MTDGWRDEELGDVVSILKGKKPRTTTNEELGLPYLVAEHLRGGSAKQWVVDTDGLVTSFQSDCLLLWDGAGAGDCFAGREGVVASTMARLRPKYPEQLSGEYLTLMIGDLEDSIKLSNRGTTVPHVSPEALKSLPVRIPPLSVQRRMVDLMTHLDKQIVNLRRELDAAECLARAQREAAFSNLLADSITASDVFEMLLGRQKSAPQSVGAHVIPYIRAANISEQGLKLDDVQTMNFNPSEQERYCLRHDDVLLVEGGTVGLAARWSSEIPGPVGFDKHVIRLRAKPMSSCSEYALQWAKWSRETGAFAAEATGITIKALGFGRACKMLVPNLALQSQFEVCAPLAALENQISLLRDELSELESLRSVILGSLLSGKLELEKDVEHLEHQAMS